jgi:chromosomal replication initiation ATPase DnaA
MIQDAFPLVWPERFARDDFAVTDVNRIAFDFICYPDTWRAPSLCVVGPAASGKTHLAHIFTEIHGSSAYRVIDNAEAADQESLFHAYNSAAEHGQKIAFFMKDPPATWVTLPDLLSRLNAGARAVIDNPDEKTMAAVYRKLFADRGLMADDATIAFLTARSERSYAAMRVTVAKLDRLAMEQGRKPTRPFVAGILDRLFDA